MPPMESLQLTAGLVMVFVIAMTQAFLGQIAKWSVSAYLYIFYIEVCRSVLFVFVCFDLIFFLKNTTEVFLEKVDAKNFFH
jgi:hypothetical protein